MAKKSNTIFGIRSVLEAIESGKSIDKVLISKSSKGDLIRELQAKIKSENVTSQYVPKEKFFKFQNRNHQGVLAFISPIDYQNIEDIVPFLFEQGKTPFVLVLDGVTDVRNFGSIARSAECAGVDAIVIPVKGAAQVNDDAIKTSQGALFKIPVCRVTSLSKCIDFLSNSGLQSIACTEKGTSSIFETEMNGPTCLIMGSEDIGISNDILKKVDYLAQIPMKGKIGSLNVAVAAGICMFEVSRQHSLHENS